MERRKRLVTSTMRPEDEVKAFRRACFDFIEKPVKEGAPVTRVKRAPQFNERMHHVAA